MTRMLPPIFPVQPSVRWAARPAPVRFGADTAAPQSGAPAPPPQPEAAPAKSKPSSNGFMAAVGAGFKGLVGMFGKEEIGGTIRRTFFFTLGMTLASLLMGPLVVPLIPAYVGMGLIIEAVAAFARGYTAKRNENVMREIVQAAGQGAPQAAGQR